MMKRLIFSAGIAISILPITGSAAQKATAPSLSVPLDPLHVILYDDRTDSGKSYDSTSTDPTVKAAMSEFLQGNRDEAKMESVLNRFRASPQYQSALKSLKDSISDCAGSRTYSDILSGDQSGSIELDTLMLPSSMMSYSVLINFPSLVYTGVVSVGVQQSLQYDHDSLQQDGIESTISSQILGAMNTLASQNRQSCAVVKTMPAQSDSQAKVLNEGGSGSPQDSGGDSQGGASGVAGSK
jgi:hypothetical protein